MRCVRWVVTCEHIESLLHALRECNYWAKQVWLSFSISDNSLFFQNNLGDWMISNISSNKLGHSWRLSFGLFFMACLWVETKVI